MTLVWESAGRIDRSIVDSVSFGDETVLVDDGDPDGLLVAIPPEATND